MRYLIGCLALFLLATPSLAGPRVIASILPVQGIAAAVMAGTGEPELLLEGQRSEHRATFTPAQIAALGGADLVFIIGHGLEAKLAQLSGSDAVNGRSFIELSEAPGVRTLAIRQGGGWEVHHHDDEAGEEHEEEEGVLAFDPHVWLDPENAKAMAAMIASELGKADPANAALYQANARDFAAKLDAASGEIARGLAGVKDRPYIVFHDAFQYFEARFGLAAVGSVTDVSAHPPSAQRLQEIRGKLAETGAVCVFREPQYDGKLVDAVIEGSAARAGVLDPLGAGLQPGPEAYVQLIANLARDLKACLAG